jgi:hypothetical protein
MSTVTSGTKSDLFGDRLRQLCSTLDNIQLVQRELVASQAGAPPSAMASSIDGGELELVALLSTPAAGASVSPRSVRS